ncbi:MAG TPA: SDR family oxidoreductase [Gemmataceae bacterium]|nr:SDR family oxidoreductase [Gemmataceae bacterium]
MSFSVKDKIALVTGANRGIGKAIVESLLKNGAKKVYAAVRNPDSAADLVKSSGGKVMAIELDLAKPATIVAAAKAAKYVQLVVNNAGVLKNASPLAADAIDALQFEMNVNVYGLIRMAQAFAPVLAANGGGAFVQLNSVVSVKNFSDFATYSASKAASYSITQGLRDKLKAQGTQVVSVHPGPIATDMADAAGLSAIAEPASLVADGIVAALAKDEFHVFPDSMAKKFWSAYQGFAKSIVEADLSEG